MDGGTLEQDAHQLVRVPRHRIGAVDAVEAVRVLVLFRHQHPTTPSGL